jgi:hypothetical protein
MVKRLTAAGGFGDDIDSLLLEQVAQAVPEQVVVIDEEDANRVLAGVLGRCDLVQRCLLKPLERQRSLLQPRTIVTVRRPQARACCMVGNQTSITFPCTAPPVSAAIPTP